MDLAHTILFPGLDHLPTATSGHLRFLQALPPVSTGGRISTANVDHVVLFLTEILTLWGQWTETSRKNKNNFYWIVWCTSTSFTFALDGRLNLHTFTGLSIYSSKPKCYCSHQKCKNFLCPVLEQLTQIAIEVISNVGWQKFSGSRYQLSVFLASWQSCLGHQFHSCIFVQFA